MRNVLLYTDEDGYWIAEVPSLPGCFSQGDTREEAIANIKEAIELYIEVLTDEDNPSLKMTLKTLNSLPYEAPAFDLWPGVHSRT
jgi:predicted RNase H-like HicB family nuclease